MFCLESPWLGMDGTRFLVVVGPYLGSNILSLFCPCPIAAIVMVLSAPTFVGVSVLVSSDIVIAA